MTTEAKQTLKIHNTATRTKEMFEPREPGKVSMYVCGPTVYDVPHLGHGRTALTYDVMRRYLTWRGYEVTMASNVTDIDDKIIARAITEGRSEPEVAQEFTAAYDKEMRRLDVLAPDSRPHATDFIEQMVEVIGRLIASGVAYEVPERGVYLSVEAVKGYGELAGRNLEQLLEDAGSRVEVDPHKRSPLDFALWRLVGDTAGRAAGRDTKPDEPSWPTPWGDGRPGWHTECVAMSLAALGEGFDIHGGGSDLVFPHHQNEWAQVEALGESFARYWVHSAMVNVGGQKMAKSVGNFTNLSEAIDEVGPRALRMAVLQTHYRKDMEMDTASLRAAAAAVERLDAFARRVHAAGMASAGMASAGMATFGDQIEPTKAMGYAEHEKIVSKGLTLGVAPVAVPEEALADIMVKEFALVMDDDFATPAALDLVFTLVRNVNTALDVHAFAEIEFQAQQKAQGKVESLGEHHTRHGDEFADIRPAAQAVYDILEILGITLANVDEERIASASGSVDATNDTGGGMPETGAIAEADIQRLMADREQAREDKDFARADAIRDELTTAGVVIEDTPYGTAWRRQWAK